MFFGAYVVLLWRPLAPFCCLLAAILATYRDLDAGRAQRSFKVGSGGGFVELQVTLSAIWEPFGRRFSQLVLSLLDFAGLYCFLYENTLSEVSEVPR